jgi:hypothetical protein
MALPLASALLTAMRVVVLSSGEQDPDTLAGLRNLGADTVVTFARPSAAAAEAAARAGLSYVPFLSVADVDRLLLDESAVAALRAMPNLAGFHFFDETVVEGYTAPEEQQRAYGILKALFPDRLVYFATRLDPVGTDPEYLDHTYRPQFTDVVAPYFYPVGTTILGDARDEDPWEDRLAALLAPVAARTPPGKLVLPVLQAFEQDGFPVGSRFAQRQRDVYARFWPEAADLAAFAWDAGPGPLHGLLERPQLRREFARLFLGLTPAPETRAVAIRGPAGLEVRP